MSKYLIRDDDLCRWEDALRENGSEFYADEISEIRLNYHQQRDDLLERIVSYLYIIKNFQHHGIDEEMWRFDMIIELIKKNSPHLDCFKLEK